MLLKGKEKEEQIGTSVHRLIDPSVVHGVGFRWADEPMNR